MCYDPALVRDKPLGAPASVKLVYSDLDFSVVVIPKTMSMTQQLCTSLIELK